MKRRHFLGLMAGLPAAHLPSPPTSSAATSRPANMPAWLIDQYTFESFVVGAENFSAFHVANHFARGKQAQIYIQGDVGDGKTHLLHAIAHQILENNPTAKITYFSGEKFVNEYAVARKRGVLKQFHSEILHSNYLLIDELAVATRNQNIQSDFSSLLYHCKKAYVKIALCGFQHPHEIPRIDPVLQAQLSSGHVTSIGKASLKLRREIAQSITRERSLALSPEVLEYVARTSTRSVRVVTGNLLRLNCYHDVTGIKVTPTLAEGILNGSS